MTIAEIIEKLEKAEGADRDLDAAIHIATNPPLREGYRFGNIPVYTSSIDAAVQLYDRVLPGFLWGITQDAADGDVEFQGNVWPNAQPFDASKDHFGYHSRAAIALCIAILRALQTKEGE